MPAFLSLDFPEEWNHQRIHDITNMCWAMYKSSQKRDTELKSADECRWFM